MKISVLTIVRNNKAQIADAMRSVQSQDYADIEHVIVDGASTDGTLDVIRTLANGFTKFVSEPDSGIYHALNKAVRMATGDVIGILHADDLFFDSTVISRVAEAMENPAWDACHGNLLYVSKLDPMRVIRTSSSYRQGMFLFGWMPAHPTLFVRSKHYHALGLFREDFRIASDYELMLRFLHLNRLKSLYIPYVFTRMRMGGASNASISNILRKTKEDCMAWMVNGHWLQWLIAVPLKNVRKIEQFFS